jgi:hypothetical protein
MAEIGAKIKVTANKGALRTLERLEQDAITGQSATHGRFSIGDDGITWLDKPIEDSGARRDAASRGRRSEP